jgi:7-cyano-7-deazaguanine reductase
MKTKLGQQSEYKDTYWPECLDFVPRSLGRANLTSGLFGKNGSANGVDIWHAYEFSWLDNDGSPENAILRIIFPSTSEYIVESKSLKLYLGSFAFEKALSAQQIVETIQKDLSKGTGSTVDVQALNVDAANLIPSITKGYCIDLHSVRKPKFEYDSSLLRAGSEEREELLYSDCFRSLCPVTAQPDWARVVVMYKGKEILPENLRRYLISFRRHQGFHESCCEIIYNDIMSKCSPEELTVMCCFTRRGGLDINPIRSNSASNRLQYARTVRQ